MKSLQFLTIISVYNLWITVSGDTIDGQYVISFDNHCLAATRSKRDVIRDFFSVFTCYDLNTQSVDLYPNIGDYFIVVNKHPFCYDNTIIESAVGDFCINTIQQDAYTMDLTSYKYSECKCTSRNVDPVELYNLDSLTPQVSHGFEFMKCLSGYDPGFDIIVMDSGINDKHKEFDGIIYERIFDAYPDQEIHTHGTAVAGVIIGQTYGAFRAQNTQVKLLDVRHTDDGGGIQLIDRINGYKSIIDYLKRSPTRKAIVNFSFGRDGLGDDHDPLIEMIRQNGGIIFASAGNSKQNSCLDSPQSSSDTFTVGAVDRNFEKWAPSGFGDCVSMWAPGVNITTAHVSGGSIVGASGTSLAAPLVAGVAANILIANPQFSFDDIKGKLLSIFGAKYDINFERPDVTNFDPRVVNQPRIQGSCELYGVNEIYGNNAYENNKNNEHQKEFNTDQSKYDDGYRYNGYGYNEHDNNGYGNNRYRNNGYDTKRYAYNIYQNKEYERNRYGHNGYGYSGYGNNEYGNNKYQRKGYKRYENGGNQKNEYDRKGYAGKRYGNKNKKNERAKNPYGNSAYSNNPKYRR